MGHREIGVTMNVYGHLFDGKQDELTNDLDDLRLTSSEPACLKSRCRDSCHPRRSCCGTTACLSGGGKWEAMHGEMAGL